MSKTEVATKQEEFKEHPRGNFTSAFPLNPLDLSTDTQLLSYDLISMPPVSLVDNVQLNGSYYQLSDKRCIPTALAYRFPGA